MKNPLNFSSLYAFMKSHPTEEQCRNHFRQMRINQGLYCPHCSNRDKKIYEYKNTDLFKCSACKKQFTLTKGTIFERTHIPLDKWFMLILIFLDKKAVSAKYISRELEIAYPNAYHALQRIRQTMNNYHKKKLDGIVEIDETMIGGLQKNKHYNKRVKGTQGRSCLTKRPLLGFISRGGEMRLLAMRKFPNRRGFQGLIRSKVEKGAIISTDEYNGYDGLNGYYSHGTCNHGAYQYVNNGFHTNTMESAWSHLKRAIKGIYHHVSLRIELLKFYCFEYVFRHNNRKAIIGEKFDRLLVQTIGTRLMRKEML